MPYPNEHSCRLQSPESGKSFRRENDAAEIDGRKVDHVFMQKEDGTWVLQAVRFPTRNGWDTEAATAYAREWCSEHPGTFEQQQAEKSAAETILVHGFVSVESLDVSGDDDDIEGINIVIKLAERDEALEEMIRLRFPESLRDLLKFSWDEELPTENYIPLFDLALQPVFSSQELVDQTEERVELVQADEEKRWVTGLVMVPGEPDTDNEFILAEGIEDAIGTFASHRRHFLNHGVDITDQVELVESYLAPVDFLVQDERMGKQNVPKGSWVMTLHILDDALWAAVKSGELTGFSARGLVSRKPA